MQFLLVLLGMMVAMPEGRAQTTISASEYVAAAAASGLYERTSSDFVLRDEAIDGAVRHFAQTMVADHNAMSVTLREAAEKAGVAVGVPTMTDEQQAMIGELQASRGMLRAQIYMTQQVKAHRKALALHQAYAWQGDIALLRGVAAEAAKVVEGHLKAMEQIRVEG
jgi:putative membrane protein